jgi:hypothetical protein
VKLWEIEEKIFMWIGLPVVLIGLLLFIYIHGWAYWSAWLWEMGGLLLSLAFACGLVCMLISSLLYFSERKKREQLEQEIRKLQYLNAQITYLDEKGDPCTKEQAVKIHIIEAFSDGSRRETYGIINKGKP